MHEPVITQVQANVRHLSVDVEEQQIADLQIATLHGYRAGPKRASRTGNRLPGASVGVVHEATAVEALGIRTAEAIRNANLLVGNRRRFCTNAVCAHRCFPYRDAGGSLNRL